MLHEAVRTGLETFLAELRDSGARPLPRYVLEALRGYLRCGVLAYGFSRWHCDRCDHDLLVAFSCKKRSICPSCGVRRMDEVGAALVDRVLPDVPYRQWVLSLPWELRALCARRADVLTAVGRALWQSLRAELRRRSGRPDGEPGAVTFVQRFGGSLNLNVHLHVIVADGVFVESEGGVRLLPLAPPTADEVARVVGSTRARILRWLGRKGYLEDDDDPRASYDEDAPDGLEACQRTFARSAPRPRPPAERRAHSSRDRAPASISALIHVSAFGTDTRMSTLPRAFGGSLVWMRRLPSPMPTSNRQRSWSAMSPMLANFWAIGIVHKRLRVRTMRPGPARTP